MEGLKKSLAKYLNGLIKTKSLVTRQVTFVKNLIDNGHM